MFQNTSCLVVRLHDLNDLGFLQQLDVNLYCNANVCKIFIVKIIYFYFFRICQERVVFTF